MNSGPAAARGEGQGQGAGGFGGVGREGRRGDVAGEEGWGGGGV